MAKPSIYVPQPMLVTDLLELIPHNPLANDGETEITSAGI